LELIFASKRSAPVPSASGGIKPIRTPHVARGVQGAVDCLSIARPALGRFWRPSDRLDEQANHIE
jgi:hypothetical protein